MTPRSSRTGLGPIRRRREIFFEGQAHQLCQTDAGNARAAQDPFSRQPADRDGQGSAGGRGDAPHAQESQAPLMPFEPLAAKFGGDRPYLYNSPAKKFA